MTPIPESGLDYLILSKEDATALSKYFQHQYIHYDDTDVNVAVTKIISFADRQKEKEDESIETNRMGIGEDRQATDSDGIGRADRNVQDGTDISSS